MQQQNYQDLTLEKLAKLDRDDLLKHWPSLYGKDPPASMSRSLLLHAIGYRIQEKFLGGLKSITRRQLSQFATSDGTTSPAATSVRSGTRLLREWHGVTYEVMVCDDGVVFKGKRYRSLTEVTFAITGAKWSGPKFFGLRRKSHG